MKTMLSITGAALLLVLATLQAQGPTNNSQRPQLTSPPPLQSELVLSAAFDLSGLQNDLTRATSAPIRFSGRRGGCFRADLGLFKIPVGCSWAGTVTRRAPPQSFRNRRHTQSHHSIQRSRHGSHRRYVGPWSVRDRNWRVYRHRDCLPDTQFRLVFESQLIH